MGEDGPAFAVVLKTGAGRRFFTNWSGGSFFRLELPSFPDGLQQSAAGSVLVIINQGAVPCQFVGAPPDGAQQDDSQKIGRVYPHQVNPGRSGQGQSINCGVAGALLDADSGDRKS